METGFSVGSSDNLPQVDVFAVLTYFGQNDFVSSECRNVRATRSSRDSYGDNAVGYVQVKRDGKICTVKAKVTPEHKISKKDYKVEVIYNEEHHTVESATCEDCPASQGGCKHVIAFVMWLHRRSEEPSPTDVQCYWKKSTLSKVGTSIKFIKAKELGSKTVPSLTPPTEEFRDSFVDYTLELGINDTQLSKYFAPFSKIQKTSVHFSITDFVNRNKGTVVSEFFEHIKSFMENEVLLEIEEKTRDQSNSPLWYEVRYGRITASKAYEATRCKTYDGSLVETILGAEKLKDTEAMARGRRLEKEVLLKLQKDLHLSVKKCGIFLKKEVPIMGASPDGITDDTVFEIKCPFSKESMKRYITTTNNICSKYYAQIQLQMYFSGKILGKFCVASPDFEVNKKIIIVDVAYDEEFCKDCIEKCQDF